MIEKGLARIFGIALFFNLSAGSAMAACATDSFKFSFGQTTETTMHITGGSPCVVGFMIHNMSFTGMTFSKPQHGAAGWNRDPGYPKIEYLVAHGYRGTDTFTFDVVGEAAASARTQVSSGAAHVIVHVDSQ